MVARAFSVNGEVISDLFKITGPLTLSSTWNYSLVTLAVAGISSSSIGFTAWSIMKRAAGFKGKREKEEDEYPVKQGKGIFASLTKLRSRFKRDKPEEPLGENDPPPDDSHRQTLSNLMKSHIKNRNDDTSEMT